MSDVESYIARFPPEVQSRLNKIRRIGFDVFSNAEEKIYHGVPTFITTNGKDILNYGAYKDHITLYVGYDMKYFLQNAYPQYHYTKAAIKFPHRECFPIEYIQEICELLCSNIFGRQHNENFYFE
jgi:uncharacterized protein YdhG (YjbR/CyaY superfamily)